MPYKDKNAHNARRRAQRAEKKAAGTESSIADDDSCSDMTPCSITVPTDTAYDDLKKEFEEYKQNQKERFEEYKEEMSRLYKDLKREFYQYKERQNDKVEALNEKIFQLQNTIIQNQSTVTQQIAMIPTPRRNRTRGGDSMTQEIRKTTTKEYLQKHKTNAYSVELFVEKKVYITPEDFENHGFANIKEFCVHKIKRAINDLIAEEGMGDRALGKALMPIQCTDVKRRKYYVKVDKLNKTFKEQYMDEEDTTNKWIECYDEKRIISLVRQTHFKVAMAADKIKNNKIEAYEQMYADQLAEEEEDNCEDGEYTNRLEKERTFLTNKYNPFMAFELNAATMSKLANTLLPLFKFEKDEE